MSTFHDVLFLDIAQETQFSSCFLGFSSVGWKISAVRRFVPLRMSRAFLWIFFFSHLILSTKYVFSVPSTSTPPFVTWRNQKPHGNKCVCRCSIQILSRFSFRGAYEFRILGSNMKRGVERIIKSGVGLLIAACMSQVFPRFPHHTRIFQLISPIIRLTTARS